jgi:rubredoxin
MKADAYMQSILWCCSSCGFVLDGGQPTMECAICESYKDAFIDSPAHVESEIRDTHGELFNGSAARAERLEKLRAGGYLRSFRVKGRITEAVNAPDSSRKFT